MLRLLFRAHGSHGKLEVYLCSPSLNFQNFLFAFWSWLRSTVKSADRIHWSLVFKRSEDQFSCLQHPRFLFLKNCFHLDGSATFSPTPNKKSTCLAPHAASNGCSPNEGYQVYTAFETFKFSLVWCAPFVKYFLLLCQYNVLRMQSTLVNDLSSNSWLREQVRAVMKASRLRLN